jgi:Family of unknown function (DUF6416)
MVEEGLQEVKVLVPVERVAQFYEMVGRWLAGPADGEAAADGVYKPWSDDDLVLAKKVWNKLSPWGRELFSVLMDHPEQRVSTTKLAEDLGIANAQVRGVVGWPARHCYAVGRDPVVEAEEGLDDEFANYWMASNVAALFREARDGK